MVVPDLFGQEIARRGGARHRGQFPPRRQRLAGQQVVLAPLPGEQDPQAPPGDEGAGRVEPPRTAGAGLAVAIVAVAVPQHALRGLHPELGVHYLHGIAHRGVVGRLHAQPHQLKEARVHHAALVDGGPAVADGVAGGRVGVAVFRQPEEVRLRRVRAVRGHRPRLDLALPAIGHGQVTPGQGAAAVGRGDVRGADQPGDLGRDRGGRVAALILPALLRGPGRPVPAGAVADEEVGRPPDVAPVRCVGAAELVIEQDGVGHLVQLKSGEDGLSGQRGVRREGAVRLLLVMEEVLKCPHGGGAVAVGDERRRDLVGITGPHQVVGTGRRLQARPPGPGHRRGGHERAAVGLVLQGGEDHLGHRVKLPLPDSLQRRGRLPERGQVGMPAGRIAAGHGGEALTQRSSAGGQRAGHRGGKAQGQGVGGVAREPGQRQLGSLHDVPVGCRGVVPVHPAVGAQVGPSVRGPEVAVGRPGEPGARHQRTGQPVAGGHQRPVPGGAAVVVPVVAECRLIQQVQPVPVAVEGREAQPDEHGGTSRVGHVGGPQLPAAAGVGVGQLVGKAPAAHQSGHHRRGINDPLDEPVAVGDHEVEIADAGRAQVRVVDLAQAATLERVPDLAPGSVRRTEARLAGRRPDRPLARGAGSHSAGCGGSHPAGSAAAGVARRHGRRLAAQTGNEGHRKRQRADRDRRSPCPVPGTAALAIEPHDCSSRR